MNFHKFSIRAFGLASLFAVAGALPAAAQQRSNDGLVIVNRDSRAMAVAGKNNLYCAGYVQTAPLNTAPKETTPLANKIFGAENEQEKFQYGQNDHLFINGGSNKGVKVGDMFAVIRPRGEVDSPWTKKGELGVYVQELGALEVVDVKSDHSVAVVTTSCDGILLGDLIVPIQPRVSPTWQARPMLDRFADPTGKATGRVFMARDMHEMIGRDQIVYVDLGAEDSVQVGDYLTVWRPLGKGHLFISDVDESVAARQENYASDKFKGGRFSNQAARKYGSKANRKVVTTEAAKAYRPDGLRKVVGEAVVLNVKEKTATVVITRTAQEIVTGDYVEVQ